MMYDAHQHCEVSYRNASGADIMWLTDDTMEADQLRCAWQCSW